MTVSRSRIGVCVSLDQMVAVVLLPFILVILGVLYLIVVPLQGRPFIFSGQRMRGPVETFLQHKIRTMQPVDRLSEQSVMGGDLCHRVTPIGAFLRKSRLDELPQIFNVLKGEMVFIGPRPALKKYVEADEAYAKSLSTALPGITGLATVLLHAREERILSSCKNAIETDSAYRKHCIPMKIRIDEMYRRNKSVRLKFFILWRTISRLPILEAIFGIFVTFQLVYGKKSPLYLEILMIVLLISRVMLVKKSCALDIPRRHFFYGRKP